MNAGRSYFFLKNPLDSNIPSFFESEMAVQDLLQYLDSLQNILRAQQLLSESHVHALKDKILVIQTTYTEISLFERTDIQLRDDLYIYLDKQNQQRDYVFHHDFVSSLNNKMLMFSQLYPKSPHRHKTIYDIYGYLPFSLFRCSKDLDNIRLSKMLPIELTFHTSSMEELKEIELQSYRPYYVCRIRKRDSFASEESNPFYFILLPKIPKSLKTISIQYCIQLNLEKKIRCLLSK